MSKTNFSPNQHIFYEDLFKILKEEKEKGMEGLSVKQGGMEWGQHYLGEFPINSPLVSSGGFPTSVRSETLSNWAVSLREDLWENTFSGFDQPGNFCFQPAGFFGLSFWFQWSPQWAWGFWFGLTNIWSCRMFSVICFPTCSCDFESPEADFRLGFVCRVERFMCDRSFWESTGRKTWKQSGFMRFAINVSSCCILGQPLPPSSNQQLKSPKPALPVAFLGCLKGKRSVWEIPGRFRVKHRVCVCPLWQMSGTFKAPAPPTALRS